jgi:thiamine-monophosphate kinase
MKEFSYINWIQKQLRPPREVFIPSGDDAAGVRIGNKSLLITTDLIVENIDFTLKEANTFQIGYKSIAISISDIAAMGGNCNKLYAVATVALRKNLSGRFAKELFRGMKDAADKFKVSIIGGDVSSVKGPISITSTVFGVSDKSTHIRRSGACVGDAIMVTGSLGGSILGKHLDFTPRLNEARILTRKYSIHSMIDISDGLSADLNHILQSSKKGAILVEHLIPVSDSTKKLSRKDKKSAIEHALYDGEDFELLFTLPMREAKMILTDKPFAAPVSLIGIIQKEQGIILIDKKGHKRKLKPKGYEHVL